MVFSIRREKIFKHKIEERLEVEESNRKDYYTTKPSLERLRMCYFIFIFLRLTGFRVSDQEANLICINQKY